MYVTCRKGIILIRLTEKQKLYWKKDYTNLYFKLERYLQNDEQYQIYHSTVYVFVIFLEYYTKE